MRTIFQILLLTLFSVGCKQPGSTQQSSPTQSLVTPPPAPTAAAAGTQWKTVEELDYTIPPEQTPVHLKLEIPEPYDDPGDFTRIQIQVRGQPEFVLDNEDGWIEFDSHEQKSDVYHELAKQNRVSSKYVLVLADPERGSESPLIFLRSWAYASDAERQHVIGFQPSGVPITLINTNLDLLEFADLDGDGKAEVAGRPCLSQSFGPGLLTYDPLHVYKIPYPITSAAMLSLPLTKAYNERHYYGWAGPACSEKIAVVLHPPDGGKPRIMEVKEAEKLLEESHSQR